MNCTVDLADSDGNRNRDYSFAVISVVVQFVMYFRSEFLEIWKTIGLHFWIH